MGDLVYTDLLLAIIKRLERTLAENDVKIDERLMKGISMWFAEVIYGWRDESKIKATLDTEFELGLKAPAPLPIIAKLFTKITGQIHTGHEIKGYSSKTGPPSLSVYSKNQ